MTIGKAMDIREMLRTLRKAGHTEQAIAKEIKVHQSTISRIISGKIQDPKGSIVSEIKQLFEREYIYYLVESHD